MNKETASRAALTSSLNISFFVQPTEESLNGFPKEFIGLIASFLLPVVTASVYLVSEDLLVEKIRHAFALEDLQVILGSRRQRYLARMRKMSFPAIAYHVKLHPMIVQVLGRTVSLVSDIPGDLAGTVSSAACDYRH